MIYPLSLLAACWIFDLIRTVHYRYTVRRTPSVHDREPLPHSVTLFLVNRFKPLVKREPDPEPDPVSDPEPEPAGWYPVEACTCGRCGTCQRVARAVGSATRTAVATDRPRRPRGDLERFVAERLAAGFRPVDIVREGMASFHTSESTVKRAISRLR